MNQWNKKNALWMVLYAVLYAVLTYLSCALGMIHPIFFVIYQISAGLLVTGLVIYAFRRVQAPGAAACLVAGLLLLLVIIQDLNAWHAVPLLVILVLAEAVRALMKYSWTGDVIAAVIMSFSTVGYYAQIWFNRAFTYEAAVEEMRAGYADTLMACSPNWALPVVVLVGIAVSVCTSYLTAKLFKLEK